MRLRPVRERGRVAGLLPRRRRAVRRAPPPHDAPRPAPDGGQSGGPEALPRQHAQLGRVEPMASRRRAIRRRSEVGLGRRPRGGRVGRLRPVRPGTRRAPDRRRGAQGRGVRGLPRRRPRHAGDLRPGPVPRGDRGPLRREGPRASRRPGAAGLLAARRGAGRPRGRRLPARPARADHQPRDLDDRRPELRRRRPPVRHVRPRRPTRGAATASGWRPTTSSTADGRPTHEFRVPEAARSGPTSPGSASGSTARSGSTTPSSS